MREKKASRFKAGGGSFEGFFFLTWVYEVDWICAMANNFR